MAQKISVGIDIGTDRVKVVVAENVKTDRAFAPRVIGLGSAKSSGLRHGYAVSPDEATEAVREALHHAEKSAGVKIRKVRLGVGGVGLSAVVGKGSVMVSRADSEITELDIRNVLAAAESELPASSLVNRKIIVPVPLSYKIDEEIVPGRPLGMRGAKLEARVLFVLCLEQHINDIINAAENAGLEVTGVMASPLMASLVNMTKLERVAGSVLVNIGAETTSLAVFENNLPISLEVFPEGGADITNDIALGFRIPIDEAESLKVGSVANADYPKKKLDDIIRKKSESIFARVEAHLKKIGRSGLLPAGIVITGGGSGATGIGEIARAELGLPAKIALVNSGDEAKHEIKDNVWSVAYGLAVWGLSNDDDISSGLHFSASSGKKLFRGMSDWFKQFMP